VRRFESFQIEVLVVDAECTTCAKPIASDAVCALGWQPFDGNKHGLRSGFVFCLGCAEDLWRQECAERRREEVA
jgi:hypothetical protein